MSKPFCKTHKSILNNDLHSLFSCNLLRFDYYVSGIKENTYSQSKGEIIMQHFQTSFFYDLQELIRNAPLMQKYYYIFKSLNLSDLLIENGLLSLDEFILDSKPIQAATKENNFKNPRSLFLDLSSIIRQMSPIIKISLSF